MGGSQSYPELTADLLEDYIALTYLSKGEILYLLKKFHSIDQDKLGKDFNHRFTKDEIIHKFPVLQNNPFQDRIFHVFSSKKDECFSFEDMLDLCSVMSSECPIEVKATWAFRIFDLDSDNQISEKDICGVVDRLTAGSQNLDDASKNEIVRILLKEMMLDTSGTIGHGEFKLMITRIPEFRTSFYFRP